MKTFSYFFAGILILFIAACGKDNNPAPPVVTPTSLTVSAVISADNSGNVTFTASAVNATTYEYDFGNGIFQTVANGVVTYKYPSSGTYTVNVVAKSAGGQAISKSMQVIVTVALSLLWSEEFNTAGAPDPSKWGYDLGAGGWGNNEAQHYTNRPENVIVSGGTLKIILKKEVFSGSQYTSARLLSKDKFSFKYGKVEVRAKLPAGGGTWPAIWMLGNNINTAGWPASGEIDIMEHVGNQQNKIHSTLHHPGHFGANGDGSSVIIPTASSEFHRYGMEWTAASLKFFVDDVPFYTFPNNASLPFNQNFFFILNVAMGGNFGGAIDPAFTSGTLEIDYIKVYN